MVRIRSLSAGCKIEDDSSNVSIRLDAQGRWCTFRDNGWFFRRCLNGAIVQSARIGAEKAQEELMDPVWHELLFHRVKSCLQQMSAQSGVNQQERGLIDQALALEFQSYQNQSEMYDIAYQEDVVILPPDRYGDIVVQPARGCPNRKCTFCAFYSDKPYDVLSEEQLHSHLKAVSLLLGHQANQKDGLFLGSANALALSQRRLMTCLELIEKQFGKKRRGVSAFADPDFSAPRTMSNWQELSKAGLTHAVIGLETGWRELRGKLGKSSDLSKLIHMVDSMKSVGMTVGLTVLTGACAETESQKNVEKTAQLISSMELSHRDIVYLSPLSREGSVESGAEIEKQRFMADLKKVSSAKIVPYQMQRFHYYA